MQYYAPLIIFFYHFFLRIKLPHSAMCCVAVHQDFLGAKQIEQLCQNEVGSIQMRLAAQYVVQVHESASWRCSGNASGGGGGKRTTGSSREIHCGR